jgi:hypothetical protein
MNIFTLDNEKHARFLQEQRHDPITGEKFHAGDRIVFCASCKLAFLEDSWNYLGGIHCTQSETLSAFPKTKALPKLVKKQGKGVLLYGRERNTGTKKLASPLNIFLGTVCTLGLLAGIEWAVLSLLFTGFVQLVRWINRPQQSMLRIYGQEIQFQNKRFKLAEVQSLTLEYRFMTQFFQTEAGGFPSIQEMSELSLHIETYSREKHSLNLSLVARNQQERLALYAALGQLAKEKQVSLYIHEPEEEQLAKEHLGTQNALLSFPLS